MLNLQSLTQDESKTLSINLERLFSLIEQLFYKENDTPTTEDGFNPWEVVRDTIKRMSNKQFLDVMELVKGIEVNLPLTEAKYEVFTTMMNVFDAEYADDAYNLRGAYIVATIANMVTTPRHNSLMDYYLQYVSTSDEEAESIQTVIIEERLNPHGTRGFHMLDVTEDATFNGHKANAVLTFNTEEQVSARSIVYTRLFFPNSEADVNDYLKRLLPERLAKHYVLLSKKGSLNVCDQGTLVNLVNVNQNPLNVVFDGWEATLDRPIRFIDGIYMPSAVDAVCNVIGAHYVRTSLKVGQVVLVSLGEHSDHRPVEVWYPLGTRVAETYK